MPVLIDDKFILNISNVYTDTKHRKKGYAQELINHAIEIAKEKNCVQVELSVLKGNPAKGLYEKMGFQTFEYNMKLQLQ